MTPEKLLLHEKIDALHTNALKNVGVCTLVGNKRFIHTGTERRTPHLVQIRGGSLTPLYHG